MAYPLPTLRRLAAQWGVFFALPLLLFHGFHDAMAMTVLPPTFEELVDEAAGIVRVKVIEVTPFRTISRDGSDIIKTRVTWRVLTTLKGAPSEELTLEFLGGQVGRDTLHIGGMPSFDRGDIDFLFVEAQTGVICPLIAAGHGRYRVLTDPSSRREYVARDNRTPLDNVDDVATPLHERSPRTAAATLQSALSPESFEELVLSTLKRAGGSHAK